MNFHPFRLLFSKAHKPGAREPDFLCVGMEKSATAWLFDQLRMHPDFWMPPVKEVRYLHVSKPRMEDALLMLSGQKKAGMTRSPERDAAFLKEAAALAGQPRDIEKYAQLFRFKGNRISGDISPGYRTLKDAEIASIATRFPGLRVLLLVREPVERAWSHICMNRRLGRFDGALLDDVAAFSNWFRRSPVRRASLAVQVLQRWAEFAPSVPFRYFLFDDIKAEPDKVRAEIIAFLGANSRLKSGHLTPDYNRKRGYAKSALTEPIKAVLVEELADEVRDCARVFGGRAKNWPARYGL